MQKQRDVKGVEKKGLKDQVMESLPEPRGEPGAHLHPTEEVCPPLPCRMGTRIGLISGEAQGCWFKVMAKRGEMGKEEKG